jgi:hypothetical protein
MTLARALPLLSLLALLSACDGCGDQPKPDPDDTDPATDDTGPGDDPDACDEHPGEVLCLDGVAVTCDEQGDIAAEETCVEAVCEDGVGCVACAVDLTEPLLLEDDEESVGVVLTTHSLGAGAPFEQLRLVSREVTLSAEAGGVSLSVEGAGVALFDAEGNALGEAALELAAQDLPATFHLVGEEAGAEASLVATHAAEACGEVVDSLRLRVAALPGIAGAGLEAYPWFSFHQAFETSHPVQAALDPGRLPDRVGLAADVYVVEHKSPQAWAADPSLVDVSGGVETVTLAESAILDSTVLAWEQPTDPVAALAQGYDLVLDYDGDGLLGPGDLIDGLSSLDAGFTVFGDLTAPGPHVPARSQYSGGSWLGQRTYYPEDIASLGALPLVVISHGNGHDYTWYDYLGEHLASWGYVVMAHQNNTGPGIETASTTTLTNTDYLLGNLGSIAGGALQGHVDGGAIAWIGHSRGGEGVVRAYDRLVEGAFRVDNFAPEDIAIISSIAPTVFNSVSESDPHDVPYHLLAGAADGDVTGQPDCTQCQFFRIAGAARGPLQVSYVQGAGHNDFNCCGFDDATGPAQIGRPEAQQVAKATYLALFSWYLGDRPAAGEYFQRMYDDLRPTALQPGTVIANIQRPALDSERLVLDDFQTQPTVETSSAGGAVTVDADVPAEDALQDGDDRLSYSPGDPMNGMTWVEDRRDTARGLVVGWSEGDEASVEWEVPAGQGDWRGWSTLSFQACQITRHPDTRVLGVPLDFTVTLVDGAGVESAVSFASWGGLNQPYARSGSGQGTGWANELETVRIPLHAFDAEGVALDLADVAAVRFELGEPFGSAMGRIAVTQLEVLP